MQTLLDWTLLLIAIYSLQPLFTDLATSLIFIRGIYCVILALSVVLSLYRACIIKLF